MLKKQSGFLNRQLVEKVLLFSFFLNATNTINDVKAKAAMRVFRVIR